MPLIGLATAVSSDRDFRTMTATPPSFADRPPGTDVLADMLRAVRLTGAVFLKASFTEPFGVLSPQRYDPSIPMAHLRHVSVFHYVATGGCNIETAGGQRRELVAGDLVMLPFAAEHKLWRGNAEFTPASNIVHQDAKEGVWSFTHGGGGTETRFVCGFIESAEMMVAPMFRAPPEMLVDRDDHGRVFSQGRSPDAGPRGHPGPHDGAAVRRAAAPPCRPPAAGQQGPARRPQRSDGRPCAASPASRLRPALVD